MKRSDIKVGAELAHATAPDWAGADYRIHKVTVVDTRGWHARRYSSYGRDLEDIRLEDGTQAPGRFYALNPGKNTCLVRGVNGQLALVQLAHLRGGWEECSALVAANVAARREQAQAVEARRRENRTRVAEAAGVLELLGIPVGYVSSYAEKLELGPDALEKIVEALMTPRG